MTKINGRGRRPPNACIVVLGDIGRSPRMQYHAQSLVEEKFNVDIIGYKETEPLDTLIISPNARIHDLYPVPDLNLPTLVQYMFKTCWQALSLMMALLSIPKPKFVLVQNPPGVPTLLICYSYCKVFGCKFIIDWHNYTHTILALNSSPTSYIVKLARRIEVYFGRKADANFCVTKAMKDDLEQNLSIKSTVLYDRPPLRFRPVDLSKKHEFYMKLSEKYSEFLPKNCEDFKEKDVIESTAFTQKLKNGQILCKKNRPGIVVSSTSWTPDEDFHVLLQALEDYDDETKDKETYPELICMITGKGPQKEYYKKKIAERKWNKVTIMTPWLEVDDYPIALASSDLGVSLHWSSSGLDLPMKVVDMFGCGLPVCALNFDCLNELVDHEVNGFIFNDSQELKNYLMNWFKNFPENEKMMEKYRENLKKFQKLRWTENWKLNVLPILREYI